MTNERRVPRHVEPHQKLPIEQLFASRKTPVDDFKGWLRERVPREVLLMDDSANAERCAQVARAQDLEVKTL